MAQLAPSDRQNQTFARCYGALATRLSNQSDVKSETAVLRTLLQQDPRRAAFHRAYRSVATRLTNAMDVINELTVLRTLLTQSEDFPGALQLSETYGALAQRLSETDASGEARSLREAFEREGRANLAAVDAYARLAGRLGSSDAASEASVIRALLERESRDVTIRELLRAYESLAVRVTDQKELTAGAVMLKERLAAEGDSDGAMEIAGLYSSVAARLRDDAGKNEAEEILRKRFEGNAGFVDAYVRLVKALAEPATTRRAITVVGTSIARERDGSVAETLATEYAGLAKTVVESVDRDGLPAPVAQILTLAAHPLAELSASLLLVLKPVAEGEVTSLDRAVAWSEKTFHLDRSHLRPPLQ